MTKKQLAKEVIERLKKEYPDADCTLDYSEAWQLLVSVRLAAQCTDARVNLVTKDLFVKYKTLSDFANADLSEMEQDIRQTGFYHNKAKNIIGCARKLLDEYGGEVPSDIDELTKLPGVGRKTANVIRGNVYGIASIVVDTHVKRISRRLKLTTEEDPVRIEYDLMKVIPEEYWILINIWFITFGRGRCRAQSPECQGCPLAGYCQEPAKKAPEKTLPRRRKV